jgi:uncharacterized protein DUF4440
MGALFLKWSLAGCDKAEHHARSLVRVTSDGGGTMSRGRSGNELSEDAAQPILDLQRRWVEALINADTAALDTILVDSYVDTDESGSRTGKAGILAALKSGNLKLASITLLETHVETPQF